MIKIGFLKIFSTWPGKIAGGLGACASAVSVYTFYDDFQNGDIDNKTVIVVNKPSEPKKPVMQNKIYAELTNKSLANAYVGKSVDVPLTYHGLTNFFHPPMEQAYLPKGYVAISHSAPNMAVSTSPFGGGNTAFGMVSAYTIAIPEAMKDELLKLPVPADISVHGKIVEIDPMKKHGIVGHSIIYLKAERISDNLKNN